MDMLVESKRHGVVIDPINITKHLKRKVTIYMHKSQRNKNTQMQNFEPTKNRLYFITSNQKYNNYYNFSL
jgi:hypothetical protein